MKHRYLIISLLLLKSFPVQSHPLDITLTTLQIDQSYFYGTTYIHPYELSLLVADNNLSIQNTSLKELSGIILPYFDERFKIYGKNGLITKKNLSLENTKLYRILADGLYINYYILCDPDQFPITFNVDLFVEYFNTQTNKIILLDGNGNLFPGSEEIILTAKRTEWSFDLNKPDFSSEVDDLTDSDGDGFTDRLESLYGLDPHNPDTDGDGYSDFIELSYGWDPFDKNPSPGQSKETLLNFEQVTPEIEGFQESEDKPSVELSSVDRPLLTHKTQDPRNLIKEHNIKDKRIPDSSILVKTLSKLESTFTGTISFGRIISLFLSVFVLGFLHASMPGHGKGILISYLAGENRKFRHALGFIASFSITHLIDVVILSFGLSLLSSTYQSAKVSQTLKFIGGAGLLVIAIFMIFSGIRDLKNHGDRKNVRKNKAPKIKGAAVLGFLTGLAPCPFGWALLMMLLSMDKVEMIPAIIIVFGLGIFSFLFLLTIGIYVVRTIALDLFSHFSRYSQLVSGTLLLIFALLFFVGPIAIEAEKFDILFVI